MSKQNQPTQILLDESFILCASGGGDCDSKKECCQEEIEERQLRALLAILSAYQKKISLVLDDAEPSQVARFYRAKYDQMKSWEIKKFLAKWLDGRGGHLNRYKPGKINDKAI